VARIICKVNYAESVKLIMQDNKSSIRPYYLLKYQSKGVMISCVSHRSFACVTQSTSIAGGSVSSLFIYSFFSREIMRVYSDCSA
jgi:hypothetical protein